MQKTWSALRTTISAKYMQYVIRYTTWLCMSMMLCVLCITEIGAQQTTIYYKSNVIGAKIEEIPSARGRRAFEYVLVEIKNSAQTTEDLYHNGALIQQIVKQKRHNVSIEDRYKLDVLRQRTQYDNRDQIIKDQHFDETGMRVEELIYTYTVDSIQIHVYDGNATLKYTDTHKINQKGFVEEVVRKFPDDDTATVQFTFLKNDLLKEKHSDSETELGISFDLAGRITQELRATDGETEQEIAYTYANGSRIAESATVIEYDNETVTKRESQLDERGREIDYEQFENDTLVEKGAFEYQQDTLIKSLIQTTGSNSHKETQFDAEGEIVEERWYTNNTHVRSVFPVAENEYIEERYIDGVLYVRIYFENSLRKKEEFIKDDMVIRTREFE